MKNIGLLLIRLCVGLTFVVHGYGKVFGPEGVSGFAGALAAMHIEPSVPLAWAAALSELVGGAFLAAGFLTRPAAGLIAITMAVAVFKVHWDNGFMGAKDKMGFEYPLNLLIAGLAFVLSGPGPLALDNWIKLKRAQPPKK